MGRNAAELVRRDPAAQALLGIRSDFGREGRPAPRARVREVSSFGRDYGFGREDYGFGDDAAAGGVHPAEAQKIVAQHLQDAAHTRSRVMLLEPNQNSKIKVQRYGFAIGGAGMAVTLGTPGAISGSQNPQTRFRPQRITCNVPESGFAQLTAILVANVNALVGGTFDMFDFNANAVDSTLDLPTIDPSNSVTVNGNYTGDLAGRTGAYQITVSLRGPANVAG